MTYVTIIVILFYFYFAAATEIQCTTAHGTTASQQDLVDADERSNGNELAHLLS